MTLDGRTAAVTSDEHDSGLARPQYRKCHRRAGCADQRIQPRICNDKGEWLYWPPEPTPSGA